MENLVRIKLNPRRGGPDPIDFNRPCFLLSNWPNASIEIWSSDDDGLSWQKIPETDYRFSYDGVNKYLYLSFLFDITVTTIFAFFSPTGNHAGVGWSLTRYDKIRVGWEVEAPNTTNAAAGWSTGSADTPVTPVGCSIYGGHLRNIPVGYNVKWPTVANTPVGASIAEPADSPVGAGFDIGEVTKRSVGVGVTILGCWEYPFDFVPIDDPTFASLCAEASHRKQKNVRLYGTTPEELD
jgi:hypothetical protein